jgi:phosphoribosylamine---glycine ligase
VRILLASSQGYGAWLGLRLMREGHSFDWLVIDEAEKRVLNNCLKGIIPPPLEDIPDFADYDLAIFDSTGHGELADEAAQVTPTIGDSSLASRMEDDRLFGIQVMEGSGVEVPKYAVFNTPDEARAFLEDKPGRYVYKPFEPPEETEHQESDVTYVSESCEDMMRCLDALFVRALEQPFILQEFVEGIECSANGYFDGENFHFITYCLEEKKLMSGGYGPNTGCAGNLIFMPERKRLLEAGLLKLVPFLRASGFRGPLDLNSIVTEHHVYGLEFTSRFGYDSTSTEFGMINGPLGQFLFDIAIGPVERDPVLDIRHNYGAAARYSIPPYPTEIPGKHPKGLPIKGIALEDAWKDWFLYDCQLEPDGEHFSTAGITGFVCCAISRGHTPEAAWAGVERLGEKLSVPNLQCRDDLKEATIKRMKQVCEWGWC